MPSDHVTPSRGSWSTPELPRTADDPDETQSIWTGNPHIVLNRTLNIIHVVFVEMDMSVPTSELWWVRRDSDGSAVEHGFVAKG